MFESPQSRFTSFGNRHSKMISLEIDLDGHAHHRCRRRQREYGADFLSPFEFPVSTIQELNRGTRRSPLVWIEVLTVANAGGGARTKAATDARYVAASLKGAKQSLTIDLSRWAREAARIARRPMALVIQCLPPTESFRLIKPPCRFFPTGDIGLHASRVRESARNRHFRRKCASVSAL
ncbi:hypothetical protein GGD63_006920 [Bradyrhizobium sp. cir1]|nr:hypothetical protein [Bradyrhizobium sp. cir1]